MIDRNTSTCGWGKAGSELCVRKRRRVYGGECSSCLYWVKRLYFDRFRKRAGRKG